MVVCGESERTGEGVAVFYFKMSLLSQLSPGVNKEIRVVRTTGVPADIRNASRISAA
jgi:hypothetical protein